MKLRYTGPFTVTFHTAGVGEVEPGAEFTVPDGLADSFTNRNDIEKVVEVLVEDAKPAKKKAASEPLPETADAAPATDTETL